MFKIAARFLTVSLFLAASVSLARTMGMNSRPTPASALNQGPGSEAGTASNQRAGSGASSASNQRAGSGASSGSNQRAGSRASSASNQRAGSRASSASNQRADSGASSASASTAGQLIGFIGDDITGTWYLVRGTQTLKLDKNHTALYAGWRLARRSANGSVLLCLKNQTTAICPGPDRRYPSVAIGETLSLSMFERKEDPWWRGFLSFLSQQRGSFIFTTARDMREEVFLTDSVIESQPTLNLSEVFSGLEDGEYYGRFAQRNQQNKDNFVEVKVTKKGDSASAQCADTLGPGLYMFYLERVISRTPHQWTPDSIDPAVVLVSAPEAFRQKAALFNEAVTKTNAVGPRHPGSRQYELLRQYVCALSAATPDFS